MAKGEIKLNVDEMSASGVQFGHRVSKLHPKMKEYVSGIKNNVHTFDLEKTAKEFEKALAFIAKLAAEGKTIVFVGTKIQFKNLVKESAEEIGIPYVTERWLGGTFTNFETIQKRVSYFKDLERKKETGELEKYTKRERLDFDREIAKLKIKFEGIRNMQKLPEAVVIFGIDKDITAAREAKKKGIKIVAIVDTNINPDIVDYPIPANDDAISSVKYVLEKIKDCIISNRPVK
ncbi:MAG: 30S ribosomal protein S2 [Candidatus Staskawiczbacteria bacterium]|nr:30S ribosomal protein S2 [Candidatus Staskawiczbacteria bacterium]